MIHYQFASSLALPVAWATYFSLFTKPLARRLRNVGIFAAYGIGLLFIPRVGIASAFATWCVFGLVSGLLHYSYGLWSHYKSGHLEDGPAALTIIHGLIVWPLMLAELCEDALTDAGILRTVRHRSARLLLFSTILYAVCVLAITITGTAFDVFLLGNIDPKFGRDALGTFQVGVVIGLILSVGGSFTFLTITAVNWSFSLTDKRSHTAAFSICAATVTCILYYYGFHLAAPRILQLNKFPAFLVPFGYAAYTALPAVLPVLYALHLLFRKRHAA